MTQIDTQNFQQAILEDSMEKLVLVCLWAQQEPSSVELIPVLEKFATEYSAHMSLATLDCEQHPQLAMQFQVQQVPTVMLVQQGRPIDGFVGAIPEEEIRTFLQKHLPDPADELLAQAQQQLADGNSAEAFTFAKQAFDLNSERADIKFVLIDSYIALGRIEQAKELLETIGLVDQDSTYQALKGKIELAEQASETPEIKALQAALEAEPDNMQVKVDLAVQLQQAGKAEDSLNLLLEVLRKDLNFGEAKKLTLDTINALPDGDPLASQFRRKLYSLLY